MDDLALDLHLVAGAQVTDGRDACLVDVAQRQVQQQALDIDDAELLQVGLRRLGDQCVISGLAQGNRSAGSLTVR